MNRKVIIIGASGHGKVIADIVRANGDEVLGYLDDDESKDTLGTISDWKKYQGAEFVIGIGNTATREKISHLPCKWYTAIHPSAVISLEVMIREGTVVMANVVINAGAFIGKHCIINTSAVVEHDNVIEDYAHISVGAKLGGTVKIGKGSWIGIGATVSNNLSICSDCMIGAGAVVVNDIKEKGTYIGVPAMLKEEHIKLVDHN